MVDKVSSVELYAYIAYIALHVNLKYIEHISLMFWDAFLVLLCTATEAAVGVGGGGEEGGEWG